jgi:hypothetical protein
VHTLFNTSALQCKNCGLRYCSSGDDVASSYSQHLDWHFRMRRREKENARKAQSRKWYFHKDEWIISEEIEDKEKGSNPEQINIETTTSFLSVIPITYHIGDHALRELLLSLFPPLHLYSNIVTM